VARNSLAAALGVDPADKKAMTALGKMISESARSALRDVVVADQNVIGTTRNVRVLASGDLDSAFKGQVDLRVPEAKRKVNDQQLAWMDQLRSKGEITGAFNWGLLTAGASSRAENAGLGVALIGSLFMMVVVLLCALPIGVAASIYLEEFAKKNRFTDLIEVNINNLAAVPSIVFGLLGLAVFINFFGLPRSAPLVGGLVLSLMTLPTIIIATRAALRSVPPSIRTAALGVGASKMQMVFHHVLPLATPGILTGTIIGLARALGETAPLLLIGMVAFVADYPTSPVSPATALPVQIYMWSNEAERAFVERTSGAIIVLLVFLALMNLTAILLRRRFERRW
jgi:phosphate transport system permease protein